MKAQETITLRRDCEAVLIPAGTKVTLKAGEKATITQSLGGSYTLLIHGNLVQIDGKDADALGKKPETPLWEDKKDIKSAVNEQAVWDAMRTCYDPEIPVNIVDLGLIYSCELIPLKDGGTRVEVKMTLTAPGCGMGAYIAKDVENKIRSIPGVAEVHVELVWDPPWNQDMMSEEAKLQLGML